MDSSKKILSPAALKRKLNALKKSGKKIAFTNGCFDILHFGHVTYLEQTKKNNRILVIGVNSDKSVRSIKGTKRPIIAEGGRLRLLAGLECVDFVTFFDEDTPQKLIEFLKPDILIKGADWKGKPVAGSDAVIASGGKVEFVEYVDGFSTTNIIKKILDCES
ncbi:MAG: D-glycero-beta-D-manno-heptose 1-phosphate adenylyltransferase [Candidatus Omnitrophica bacterium]|nr:D-glycero-beta-D-manno-heptose 1-phosphate adenylyltransferase [Candidatus Omnitrophota bacterium]